MNNIKKIIEEEVLLLKENNTDFLFTSSDGKWIFDFRRVFLQWKFLKEFSIFFWDKYEKDFPFQVWWLELWVIPFISWIVMEGINRWKNINSFFVRKDRKLSWLWNKIEWNFDNEKIIIVDDLFNSWKSIWKVFHSLKEEGKNIYKIFTFINFWSEEGRLFLKKNNLILDYEFTLSDFWLDSFWNSLTRVKENYKSPVIFPDFRRIYSLENFNKFLESPKSNPIIEEKNIYMWWEWWKLISICKDTWMLKWEFEVWIVIGHKNILSSPIIIKNNIIFWSYDGNLYCLDKNNWKVKWKSIYSDWIWSSASYSEKYNKIYIWLELGWLGNKGSLAWIDFSSWEKKWEVFFEDFVHCSPWYSEKLWLVICGWNDWKILCVKWDNGDVLFELSFNSPIKSGFTFSDDEKTVYFGCFDNKIYSVDLFNWNINWSYTTNNVVYAKSLVLWNNIFFGSLDKFFYHLDNKWNLIKKIRTFWKIFSEPIIIEDKIIVFASNDWYVYFYDYINLNVIFVIEHRERISTKLLYDWYFKHLYVYDVLNSLTKYSLNGFIPY